MAVNACRWVIRPEDRYQIKYEYKGGQTRFQILKDSLNSHTDAKLVDKVLESPLGNIYKAMEKFHFSSTVLHQLLIRSVYSDREDELRFRFGDSVCRFGRVEFALITGLYFGVVEPDIRSVEERNRSSLIECDNHVTGDVDMAMAPFHVDVSHITIGMLQKALMDAADAEIAYKLGLIYLIESVLHGKELNSNVSPLVFHMVDDIPRFLHYSWGSYFWDITLKNLKGKRDGLTSHIGRKSKPTKAVACMINAFFVWAYETMPSVGCLIAEYDAHTMAIPRMLRWHHMKGNIKHSSLNTNLDVKGLGKNTHLKPIDAEAKMLRGNGLADDEINTPPPVYKVPRDVSRPTVDGNPSPASNFDTVPDAAHSERVVEFDRPPSKCHKSVTGISQLHTELLGLRSYALSMNEEIWKGVKEYNEDVLENIIGVGNDIKYGEKIIRSELVDMKNDFRNQYVGLRSTMSAILSYKNRQEFNRPPQPSTTMMREPNDYHQKAPSNKKHPHTGEDQQLRPHQNQQQKGGSMISDKKTKICHASAFTPDRHFHPHPPPPRPQDLSHREMSMHVVKRGIDARKDEPSTSKKKVQLGPKTMLTPLSKVHPKGPVLSSHNIPRKDVLKEKENFGDTAMMRQYTARSPLGPKITSDNNPRHGLRKDETSISNDKVHLGDAYGSWPDPWVEVHDNVAPMSDEFILKMDMGKTASQKMPKVDGVDDIITLSDSTHCSPAEPNPRKVISTLLPDRPRCRRPTQRPSRLQDFVDPSTLARNKGKRYDPLRPIDLGKWLELCAWYNNPDARDMLIDGVYYNLTWPMYDGDPFWFQTIYTSQKWLDVTHVNAYMYLLKGRMQKHHASFKSNVCLFSHELGKFLTKKKYMHVYRQEVTKTTRKKRRLEPDRMNQSVLEGVRSLTAYSILYTPFVYDSHWVALVISIRSWNVKVYDCMYGTGKNDGLDEKLREIANNMPLLLKNCQVLMDDPRITQPFKVKRLGSKSCPQMREVGDCGVFTAKYIEHLILKDADLKDVTQDNMETFRDKMCVDIFHKSMDL